jgi:hypothetical protein
VSVSRICTMHGQVLSPNQSPRPFMESCSGVVVAAPPHNCPTAISYFTLHCNKGWYTYCPQQATTYCRSAQSVASQQVAEISWCHIRQYFQNTACPSCPFVCTTLHFVECFLLRQLSMNNCDHPSNNDSRILGSILLPP